MLGAIFGGGGPNLAQSQTLANTNQNIASNLAGVGNQALTTYGTVAPQSTAATEAYAQYLGSNPYTNAVNSAEVNRGTSGMTQAYQRAASNLAASLGQRGLSNSSEAVGAGQGLAAQQAAQQAAAQNNAANYEIAQTGNQLGERSNVLASVMGQNYNEGTGASGQAAGINTNAANIDTNIADQEYQAQQAQNAGIGSILSPLMATAMGPAGVLSGLLTKKASQGATYSPTASGDMTSSYQGQ
jgi:hypothetical protein